MKYLKHFIIGVILCLLLITYFIYYTLFLSSSDFQVKNITYYQSNLDTSLENFRIGYFSDLKYGEFMDQKRLQKVIDKVNKENIDIFIFGGDLMANNTINDQQVSELIEAFGSIRAKYGKFYLRSENDMANNDLTSKLNNLFFSANFENINDKNLPIHKNSNAYFLLSGINEAQNEISDDDIFRLAIIYNPKRYDTLLNRDRYSLILSGYTLGGQVNFPLIGSSLKTIKIENYKKGYYDNLYVNNGVGCVEHDARLFAKPEIVVIELKNKKE